MVVLLAMGFKTFKIIRDDGYEFVIRAYDVRGVRSALKRRIKNGTLSDLVHRWTVDNVLYTFDPLKEGYK